MFQAWSAGRSGIISVGTHDSQQINTQVQGCSFTVTFIGMPLFCLQALKSLLLLVLLL